MNIEELLRSSADAPMWQGDWARIWLAPDVFSAQEYIVGVVACTSETVVDFRVLTSTERFGCIYGTGELSIFDRLLNDLRLRLVQARASQIPLNQVQLPDAFRIEPVGTLRSQLVAESLERMLSDGTVPMEAEEPTGKRKRFGAREPGQVVAEVLEKVRLRVGFEADRFIREDYFGDQVHQVGVNLVTDRAAGIVASGWYASPERIQLEFLLGATKMETYVAATGRDRLRSAVFFMRPTEAHGLSRSVWKETEERLAALEWQLEQQHVRVVTHDDSAAMAGEVADWAREVA